MERWKEGELRMEGKRGEKGLERYGKHMEKRVQGWGGTRPGDFASSLGEWRAEKWKGRERGEGGRA